MQTLAAGSAGEDSPYRVSNEIGSHSGRLQVLSGYCLGLRGSTSKHPCAALPISTPKET